MRQSRYEQAVRAFREANAEDPNLRFERGSARPRELVDAERLFAWVEKLSPNASEALKLAAHCQHLRRWRIPRDSFPEGRLGYLKWRKRLQTFHAREVQKMLSAVGYDQHTIADVMRIVTKRELKSNPDVQTMEDALCLVFLQYELEQFAAKHPPDKVIDVLRRALEKMSERGRGAASELQFPNPVKSLVIRAFESKF